MDQGLAAVLAGGITGFVVLAAGWLEGRRASNRDKQSAERAQAQARADRVRDNRIEQIRETQAVVAALFLALRLGVSSRSGLMLVWRTRGVRRTLDACLHADLLLIGEIDAVVALYRAILHIFGKFPVGPFRRAWLGVVLTVHSPWDESDVETLDVARLMCLAALRRQEERALRDQDLASLDAAEVRARVDLAQLETAAARIRG